MTEQNYSGGQPKTGDHIVRRPRTTDVVGRTLRGVFEPTAMPTDLTLLIERLDRLPR